MPKCKPSQRRHPEKTPQHPRDRLTEIRAEIEDVQQQIETKRRDGRVIRTAEDFESLERAIAALTNRLSALLMAEATQVALDDPENRRQAHSLAQGAGHTIKDQGRRDVGNEREVLTHPERLILTHLVLQDSRSGQGRQFRFTPPFGSSWTSSTRESGSSRRSSRRSGNDASGGPKAPRSSARPGRSGSTR